MIILVGAGEVIPTPDLLITKPKNYLLELSLTTRNVINQRLTINDYV